MVSGGWAASEVNEKGGGERFIGNHIHEKLYSYWYDEDFVTATLIGLEWEGLVSCHFVLPVHHVSILPLVRCSVCFRFCWAVGGRGQDTVAINFNSSH